MTHNQIDYLGLQESKRNNIVTSEEQHRHNLAVEAEANRANLAKEGQAAKELAETKRNHIKNEKLTKRGQNITRKGQTLSARTTVATSGTAAASRVTSAQISASASKYASDVNAAVQYSSQANQAAIAAANRKSQKKIEKLKVASNEYLKSIDKLMQSKELSQKDRESLRKYYVELKKSADQLDNNIDVAEIRAYADKLKGISSILGDVAKASSATKGASTVKAADKTSKPTASTLSLPKSQRDLHTRAVAERTNKDKKKKAQVKKSGGSARLSNGNLIINTRKSSSKNKSTPKIKVTAAGKNPVRNQVLNKLFNK